MSIRTCILAAAATALFFVATPSIATEAPFSRTLFLGDSYTESGYYRPLLPPGVQAGLGKLTTNPGKVWSEHLADHYGVDASANGNGQTGDNYAAGGARVSMPAAGELGPIPSLTDQLAQYFSTTGGVADPRALYTVWGGINDMASIVDPSQVPVVVSVTVADQIGIVADLGRAGARYVLVPNLPDMGLIPRIRDRGAEAMARITPRYQAYNDALYGGLRQAGLAFIPLDAFSFMQTLAGNPDSYGFTNVTDAACGRKLALICGPADYVVPNADMTYLFADDVHLSTAANQMLGQYAISVLEAPRYQQVLTHSAHTVGRSRADQVSQHVGSRPADGWRWWGSLRNDTQRYDHGRLYDGSAPAGLFGVDWSRNGVVMGGFAGVGRMEANFGAHQGGYTQSDSTLGLFSGWYGERMWVNGQVSYSWLDYDVTRKVQIGPATHTHNGTPEGHNLTMALNTGYEFDNVGDLRHGPLAAIIWQRVELDDYVERNRSFTAIGYYDQKVDSAVGRIGWQARLRASHFEPYAQITYDQEFEGSKQANAWLQTVPGAGPYRVPGLEFDRYYVTAMLGVRVVLGDVSASIGVTTTTLQREAQDASLFASFSGSF